MIVNLTPEQMEEVRTSYFNFCERVLAAVERGEVKKEHVTFGDDYMDAPLEEFIIKVADGAYDFVEFFSAGREGFSWMVSKDTFYNEFKAIMEKRFEAMDRGEELEPFDPPNLTNDYGTCDSVEQVYEAYPELLTDPRHFIIQVREVKKADQPAEQGFLFHKHGEYIGTKSENCEYLYNEPNMDSVLVYHIIQVTAS